MSAIRLVLGGGSGWYGRCVDVVVSGPTRRGLVSLRVGSMIRAVNIRRIPDPIEGRRHDSHCLNESGVLVGVISYHNLPLRSWHTE